MKTIDKVYMVLSGIAAAGLFGIGGVIYVNEALPLWVRAVCEGLAVLNLVCVIRFCQGLFRQSRRK